MPALNLQKVAINGETSQGSVLINVQPSVRSGKNGNYMVGQFTTPDGNFDFKIWEESIFSTVQANGTGIYDVELVGAEFNGFYFTVLNIEPSRDLSLAKHDFLPSIPKDRIKQQWQDVVSRLNKRGVSDDCWKLVQTVLADPEIDGRFSIEGAAVYYHDNKIGGLVNHTSKMLNILASLLDNNPELQECADLLAFSITVHDIGKVFEYEDLAPSKYWYANHRVRGIETIAKYKETIINQYDETFYRHVQSVIAGHHGQYGDRPTTITAGIVHYIDTLESQTTGLIQSQEASQDDRIRFNDWGFLETLPIGRFKPVDEDSPDAIEDYFTK